jgi:Uma2 family endonuclease
MNAMTQPRLSLEAYLAWENDQPTRHEFFRGEVFAMTGARRVHGCVQANIARVLGNAVQGLPCRVFVDNMKVQIGEDTVLYPDVFVTCDRADLSTELIFRAPTVVFEVLSPSTQAYDRSTKFALYRRIATLKEYVLVDPDTRRVEAFRRNPQDQWVLHDMSDGSTLEVASLGVTIELRDVFDGVDPPPAEPASAATA